MTGGMMPNKITVEIDLDEAVRQRWRSYRGDEDYPEDPVAMLDLILQDAAFQLVQDAEVREIKSGLMTRIHRIQEQVIRERVELEVEAALMSEFQPTDTFGSAKGERTSLRAEIAKQAEAAYKALTSTGYREDSRLTKLVKEEVGRVFEGELKKALNAAKQQVVAAVHQKGASMLAGTIADMAETVTERKG
jgi:hypothetical protein